MKKLLIALFLLISINLKAQIYAGASLSTIGYGFSAGFEEQNINVEAFMSHSKAEAPISLYGIKTGYTYEFSKENSYTVSANCGLVHYTRGIFDKYNDEIGKIKQAVPLFELQAGKNMGSGRLYLNSFFIYDKIYYGINMRVYFK